MRDRSFIKITRCRVIREQESLQPLLHRSVWIHGTWLYFVPESQISADCEVNEAWLQVLQATAHRRPWLLRLGGNDVVPRVTTLTASAGLPPVLKLITEWGDKCCVVSVRWKTGSDSSLCLHFGSESGTAIETLCFSTSFVVIVFWKQAEPSSSSSS